MKKGMKVIFILGMFLSASLFGVGLFFHRVLEKPAMQAAFQQMDMVALVKNEIGERYEIIGELLDTEEFKDIISSYSDGFIDYILEGNEDIYVSKEQIRELFTNYSEILLEEYPELSILPTSKFVNFLVESIDVEKMLPSYEKMLAYVPSEALAMIKIVNSPLWFALTLALFLLCLIGYLILDMRRALLYAGGVVLLVAAINLFVAMNSERIFDRVNLKEYELFKPVLIYLCTYFQPIARNYLFIGLLLNAFGLFLKGRKA